MGENKRPSGGLIRKPSEWHFGKPRTLDMGLEELPLRVKEMSVFFVGENRENHGAKGILDCSR